MTYRPNAEAATGAVPPPGCPAHTGGPAVGYLGGGARVPMYGSDFAADPHGHYARMRAAGPIIPVELAPGVNAWLVTGYSLALDVLRDTERFTKDPRSWAALSEGRIPEDSPVLGIMMYRPNALFSDGAAHARYRGAINDSLSRIDPHALSEYVERSAETAIDSFAERGEADLLSEYAAIIPLLVFNQLFGSTPEQGSELVRVTAIMFDATSDETTQANVDMLRYLADLVEAKRHRPGADVTSWMIAHPSELSDEELMQQIALLLAAGTEAQMNLIANALRLLLSDDRFAGELSGGSLPVQDALDEVLWTDPPLANFGARFARYDVEIGGAWLRMGDPVLISYAAANNDPELAGADRIGNRAHLAWSAGEHRCPADGTARAIASVAIEKLLDRIPDLELAVPAERLTWRPGPFHRALTSLPVRFPVLAKPTPGPAPASASGPVPASAPVPPLSSAPPAGTSTARPSGSGSGDRRRPWSPLGEWWRGR
ncbi:cytochrome P450 [Streptomyces sp. NPDC044780]|uniref:cytochrome P450 n=1 Tax=unclassified Streptomyces TaxID=2593676 RepID=UPI0033F156FA